MKAEVTNSIKQSGMHKLAFFLLLLGSIVEQTSELEDTIDVDGQLLAIFLPLEVLK